MIHSDFPLIIFTVFMQGAIGLSFFAAIASLRNREEAALPRLWACVTVFAALGLGASLLHLEKVMVAHTALNNLGVSWLSNEILVVSIFFGCAAVTMILSFMKSRGQGCLGSIAALAGLASIVVQGLAYAPEAMPAINNSFPMAMFLVTSLVMGAGLSGLMIADGRDCLLSSFRTATWVLLALLLVVPCVWASGSEVMRLTAAAWGASLLFWGACICLLLAAVLAKRAAAFSVLLAIVGIFLSRVVFFVNTVHTGSNMGMPF